MHKVLQPRQLLEQQVSTHSLHTVVLLLSIMSHCLKLRDCTAAADVGFDAR